MAKNKVDWSSLGGYAVNEKPSFTQKNKFDWSSVGGHPADENLSNQNQNEDSESQLKQLKIQHPYLEKIAEMLQGNPLLHKAGDIAGHFNNAVQGTGLPSAAQGFYGTGIEMGRGLANLIPGVNIQKQDYPQLNGSPYFPYLNEGAETLGSLGMGMPALKGYQAAKKGLETLPYVKNLPNMLRNILAGSATASAISPEHRGLGATLGAAAEVAPSITNKIKEFFQSHNVGAKEKALLQAELEHERQASQEASLKNFAQHHFGSPNPEKLMLTANDKQAQLEAEKAFQRNRMGEQKMLPGEQLIPEAEHGVRNVDQVLRQKLGEGQTNIQDLSKNLVDEVEGKEVVRPHPKTGLPQTVRQGGLRKAWGDKMDKLENDLPEIEIPTTDTKSVNAALKTYYGKKSDVSEEDKENFKKLITPAYTKNKKINGRQFFRGYRSLRNIEGQERSKAFGLDPKAHDEWIDRANETKKTYENMEKIIKKHFPEGTMKRLYELNHEYSTKIGPLNENSLYQQMKLHGRYKGNIIDFLSGTTKGNDILRNLIQNNPELSRLALGHTYAEKPGNLLKPNAINVPYINANPEISNLLRLQRQAHGQLENANQNAQLYKQVENIPQLSKEIEEQKKIIQRLKDEEEATGLSKQAMINKKYERDLAERKMKKLRNKLISTSAIGTALGYGIKKIRE